MPVLSGAEVVKLLYTDLYVYKLLYYCIVKMCISCVLCDVKNILFLIKGCLCVQIRKSWVIESLDGDGSFIPDAVYL